VSAARHGLERGRLGDAANHGHEAALQIRRADADPALIQRLQALAIVGRLVARSVRVLAQLSAMAQPSEAPEAVDSAVSTPLK